MRPGFGLILLTLLNTTSLFLLSKSGSTSLPPTFLVLGQFSALIGTSLLAWSYFLSTRISFMEHLFGGLDKVYKYHHITGGISFIFLLNHPLLLAINTLPNSRAFFTYFVPGSNLGTNLGLFSLYLLILLLLFTLYIRLPYHIWKTIHEYSGLVMLLGGLHAYLVPSDISRFTPLRIWMLGLIFLSLIAIIYIRFFYRRFGSVYKYEVTSFSRLGDILDIELSPLGKPIHYSPGQFAFIKFPGLSSFDQQPHPFSFSSAPQNHTLRFSIKASGDYTRELQSLRVGQTTLVSGPHGQFLDYLHLTQHAVFIAGGIGITPFLSALSSPQAPATRITLIHSISNASQSVYDPEISLLSSKRGFTYHLHNSLSQGRLTAKRILENLASDTAQIRFFLCGPTPMMHSLADQLIGSGIRPSRIIFEDFSFV